MRKTPSSPAQKLPAANGRIALPDFELGRRFTREQVDFFETYGFIRFKRFAQEDTLERLVADAEEIDRRVIAEGRVAIGGVPLIIGTRPDGSRYAQRMVFGSLFGEHLHAFLRDPRLDAIVDLVGPGYRVGERERDGLVINHFRREEGSAYTCLGWHTDAVRDAFSFGTPRRDLNVGIYLDDSSIEKGGLRLIPSSHRQSAWESLTRKRFFADCSPDPEEYALLAEAGDLTVHDGRMWHRVAPATVTGDASRRRVAYVHVCWPRHFGVARAAEPLGAVGDPGPTAAMGLERREPASSGVSLVQALRIRMQGWAAAAEVRLRRDDGDGR